MKDEKCIESQLKELLSRFIDAEILTADLIVSTHRYLFQEKGCQPFFKNTELFDTVVYLKDIMKINHLHDLEGIFGYYERKKKSIRTYIDTIVLVSEDAPANLCQIMSAYDINWEKPVGEPELQTTVVDEAMSIMSHYTCSNCYGLAPLPTTPAAQLFVLQIKSGLTAEVKEANCTARELQY